MKKLALIFWMVMTACSAVKAQTDRGDWMVGGNMIIKTPKNNSLFALQPSAGYFFANNFAAGALFNISFEKTGDQKTNEQSAGPFARYYFNLKNPAFKPFLHAEWNIGNKVTTLPSSKTTNTTSNFLLGAGGAFFINSNVALEAVAGFTHSKVQSQDPENGFLFRIGFQVHLLSGEVDRVRGK
jgi:hypothetical protein